MQNLLKLHTHTVSILNQIGEYLPALLLRIILAWEFGEAGYQKLHGSNWFQDLTFPFPFNLLSAEVNWHLATTFELIGATALLLGFATRFFSLSLIVITIVAIATVHWPQQWNTFAELLSGYRVIDENGDGFGNYKLPIIFIVMLLALLFNGAGKLSIDNLINKMFYKFNVKS